MKSNNIYDKILGTLNGISLGDAFGMPTEMFTYEDIRNKIGVVDNLLPGQDCSEISRGFSAGETTDDTAFSQIICQVLIENKGMVNPFSMVEKVKQWANDNKKSKNVLGPSTKRAFQEIDEGKKIEVAGRYGTTNGAAMRILPVGIVFDYRKTDSFVQNVVKACLPTHNTNIAISGAMAVAGAVSCCIRGGGLEDALHAAEEAARNGAALGYIVSEVRIDQKIEQAVQITTEGGNRENVLRRIYTEIGTWLPTEQAVPSAIALAYFVKGDPMLCARCCANLGGDTDTIGAIACGICGAFSGIKRFDHNVMNTIVSVNNLDWQSVTQKLMPYVQ